MRLISREGAYAGVVQEFPHHVGVALLAQGRAVRPADAQATIGVGAMSAILERGSDAGSVQPPLAETDAAPPTPRRRVGRPRG